MPSGQILAMAGIGRPEQSGPFGVGPELLPAPIPDPELDPLPEVGRSPPPELPAPLPLPPPPGEPPEFEPDGGGAVAPASTAGGDTGAGGFGVVAVPEEVLPEPAPPVPWPPVGVVPDPLAAAPPPFAAAPGAPLEAPSPLLLPPASGLGKSGVTAPEQAAALRIPIRRKTRIGRMSACKRKHRARALP